MLLAGNYDFDARVQKEARALQRAGYRVTVCSLYERPGRPSARIDESGVRVITVAPIGLGLLPALRRLKGLGRHRRSDSQAGEVNPLDGEAPRAFALKLRTVAEALARPLFWWQRHRITRALVHAGRSLTPDVFHAHDLHTLPAAVAAADRTAARVVYDSHELATEMAALRPVEKWHARRTERRLIQNADTTVTVSDGIADELVRRYRIDQPHVVRNIPDLPQAGQAVPLRQLLDIPADHTLLLHQGMMSPHRGLEAAVAAMPHLPSCTLVLLGPDTQGYRTRLRDLVHEVNVRDRVRFHARVPLEELPEYTAAADIGLTLLEDVVLNHRWALPNKLFEYVAAGVAVVASDLPEIRRIVEHYGIGTTCDPTDPRSIAASVEELRKRGLAHYRRHSQRASEELTWSVEQRRLLDAYRQLEASPAGPSTHRGRPRRTPRSRR